MFVHNKYACTSKTNASARANCHSSEHQITNKRNVSSFLAIINAVALALGFCFVCFVIVFGEKKRKKFKRYAQKISLSYNGKYDGDTNMMILLTENNLVFISFSLKILDFFSSLCLVEKWNSKWWW